MNTNEITMRQFFEAVINGNITPAMVEKAKAEIAKLDATNAKRAEQQSKKSKENEPIKVAIVNLLTEKGAMVASAIGAALTTPEAEVTTSKASALCGQLDKAEILSVEDVKIPKKGTVKQYSIKAENAE